MADPISITRTKIIVPRRRADLLSRPRLLGLMDDLLDNKLIIIAAPAGYGKTSLLIDFVDHAKLPVCWYALDSLDQDPLRFLSHFISSLTLRFPRFGRRIRQILQGLDPSELNLEALVPMVINDAYESIHEHFAIILDDYHLVESSQAINQFVNRFVQEVDENCHLIIASRTLLTLPDLPLLVARSQVGGLSFEELIFQPDEIQQLLLQNYHLTLSDSEAIELAQMSEGWITGLLLSTQNVGRQIADRLRVARVSGIGLYDYLAQQVLNQQPTRVQRFLMRTSLLEEFDAELCEEVLGTALSVEENWRDLMEAVLRHNLFILPLGDERLYLRYHHLFRDFLQNLMLQQHPDEAQAIYQALAKLYRQRREWERAYQVYSRLGQKEEIVCLLEQAGAAMISAGRYDTVLSWLESLPSEMRLSHGVLLSLHGVVLANRGEIQQGTAFLSQAIEILRKQEKLADLIQALIRRATNYRLAGDYRQAQRDAQEALELCGFEEGLQIYRADALFETGTDLHFLGQSNRALECLEDALKIYQALGDESTAAKIRLQIGMVCKSLGKYPAAEQAYLRALRYYQETNNYVWQANLYNNLGNLQHVCGDYEQAITSLNKAIHYARLNGVARLEAYALASIGDLYRDLDALAQCLDAYRQAHQIARHIQDHYLLFYLDLAQARVLRIQNHVVQGWSFLRSAQQMAKESDSVSEKQLCRLEVASFYLMNKDFASVVDELKDAAVYFDDQAIPADSARAHLILAIAHHGLSNGPAVRHHLQRVNSILSEAGNQHLAIVASREVLPYLQDMLAVEDLSQLVQPLMIQLELFDQHVAEYRRSLRRQPSVVPFSPAKVIIRALGKVQVKVGDQVITNADWQIPAARDLLFLLMATPEGLTKEQIGEVFWPDSSISELKIRFKNAVYRLRQTVGKDAILFQDEIYRFNTALDYESDVETFLREVQQAQSSEEIDRKIVCYRNAIKQYKGDYLPGVDYPWVITERERLHNLYLEVVLRLSGLYLEKRQYEAALTCCRQALEADPYHEEAYRTSMRIYAAMGNRAAVVRQYEKCVHVLREEIGIPPSELTRSLYEVLIR